MGRAIERIALERGHEIVCRIDADNIDDIDGEAFATADAAIEFTMPSAAAGNCLRALKRGVPVVSGTTGWSDKLVELRNMCDAGEGTLMWSSNYSIGVNLFKSLNIYLAKLMKPFKQYRASMNEVHHIHKLDHPSGTAITLAEGIIGAGSGIESWTESATDDRSRLVISHERRGEVPGIHTITWDSPVDSITISHEAKSRDGFALGAVLAAEWLAGKKGYHTIDEFIAELLNK